MVIRMMRSMIWVSKEFCYCGRYKDGCLPNFVSVGYFSCNLNLKPNDGGQFVPMLGVRGEQNQL